MLVLTDNIHLGRKVTTEKFSVFGTSTSLFYIDASGNLVASTIGNPGGTYTGVLVNTSGTIQQRTLSQLKGDLGLGASVASGTAGQTLRSDGTNWIASSLIYNDGANVGIGTTGPTAKLQIGGTLTAPGIDDASSLRINTNITAFANGDIYGFKFDPTFTKTATGTHVYFLGLNIQPPVIAGGAATVTNAATVYVGNEPTGATNNYALWVAAGKSIFGGNVGIGTTGPTAVVHIKAGTTSANTAPLKFTAGTNLTTPEAGALEWDGTNLFITQTTGPTRKTLAYIGDVTGMTYPGAGIPLSTGSAWSTSITDNSGNWNTAYGWGNHSSGGYASASSSTYVGTTAVALNRLSANQALTGILSIALPGATSGTITITPTAIAGTTAITIPASSGTLALTSDLHSAVTIGTGNGLSLSTQALSLALSSTSTTGALSNTDWNTFNSKQAAGSYITSVGTGVTNEITYWSGTNTLGSLTTASYPSLTELSYVKGVTSGIQSQLNAKGVGDMTLAGVQSVTGLKTFDTTKVAIKGSSTGTTAIASANAGVTSYTATLQAATGTLAYTSDLHNAVTIGTANGLSLSTQALSLAAASTSVTGALTSTDWNTFNGKQTALVSGTNIKTVNSTSLLGSGDVAIAPMVYPGSGVANSTGSAWGTSYAVGASANNLVQLNGSAQLPAVSAALLTNFPTFNQNTTGTAAGLSSTLVVGSGGTGLTSYTVGDIIYASATTTLSKLADIAVGNALITGGVGVAPSYGKIGLTTHISGILSANNGGTGLVTFAKGDLFSPGDVSSQFERIIAVTANQPLLSAGVTTIPAYAGYYFSGTAGQTYTFPSTSGTLVKTTDLSPMVYPGAGVANSTGSAWGTSYTVGTSASNLVQLNGSAQLPAVSAALLTNFPTLNQSTTGTAGGVVAEFGGGAPKGGNATLVSGTKTVNTTAVTADSIIMLTRKTAGGTTSPEITYTISAGSSFTITSGSGSDTSTFSWFIVEGVYNS